MTAKAQTVTSTARRASESPWLDRAARLGFVARGVVYAIVAFLAIRLALGHQNGEQANKQGALQEIADQPLGEAALVLLAVGLAGYALWRFSEAAFGHRDEHDEKKRTVKRLASAGRGVVYAAFCASAVAVIAGRSAGNGEQQPKTWTARVLGWPGGRFLVIVAGVALIGGGIYLMVRGVITKFEEELQTGRMSPATKRAVVVLGVVGSIGRGVVFGLVGLLLIKAAADFDPNEAQGVDGTLRTIAQQSYGEILLGLTALALFAFAAYSVAEARYRRL
ncbi:MAG TPA: DUF1206 domain-containing protein [Acidimicrobiales bacterium]|jgi:hypothetical protein